MRHLFKLLKVDVAVDPAAVAMATLAASGASGLAKLQQKVAKLRRGPRAAKKDSLASLLEASGAVDPLPSADQFVFLRYASQHWIAHTRNLTETTKAWSQFIRLVVDDGHFAGLSAKLQSPAEDAKLLLRYIHDFNHKALLKALLAWRQESLDGHVSSLFLGFGHRGLVDMATMILESKMLAETDVIEQIEQAAAAAQRHTFNKLIEAVAIAEAPNRYLALGLRAAAEMRHIAGVVMLLASGADTEITLTAALRRPDTDMVRLLLDAGANFSAGKALYLTEDSNTLDILRLGDWHSGGDALELEMGDDILGFIDRLLRAGVLLVHPAGLTTGRTSLQATAEKGLFELSVRLICRVADVNAAPAAVGGRNALQAAAEACHLTMVDVLLNAGADVNVQLAMRFGHTALQAAARTSNLVLIT